MPPRKRPSPVHVLELRSRGLSWFQVASELRCTVAAARWAASQAQLRDAVDSVADAPDAPDALPKLANGPALAAFEAEADASKLADGSPRESTESTTFDTETPAEVKARRLAAEREAKDEVDAAARDARIADDYEPLKPGDEDSLDDDLSVGNVPESKMDKKARSRNASEKRQEYNRAMGEFARDFASAAEQAGLHGGDIAEHIKSPEKHANYIQLVAEQERRFGTRRWSRSLTIAEAHEQLNRQAMMWIAEKFFANKIEPTGYAKIKVERSPKRSVCLLLSDLHFGSELDSLDEPVTYTATQEARRIEYVMRQLIDYKPQYRENSEAVILLNGDVIEGQLMHDFRSGAPLAEQKTIFLEYFAVFAAQVSAAFPSVRWVCQPGNHGRDKVRHPGRATARKWDGHEWELYYSLSKICSGFANTTWSIPLKPLSIVDLHGSTLGLTHADTEVKLGDPDTKAKDNERILDRINARELYVDPITKEPVDFDAWAFGHYHKPRYVPSNPRIIWNGPLVPPNGYARGAGYFGEPCGQFLWEAVEGHPVGDVRFVEVGRAQDEDEKLGTLIKPFRFAMHPELFR